jgi:chorismate lyase / 3-hydroxybenzoate synthase
MGCVVCSVFPVSDGFKLDSVFPEAFASGRSGVFDIRKSDRWTVGTASVPDRPDLSQATSQIYRDLFRAAEGLNLCRIWNFVPDINGLEPTGLERYRSFSRVRSLEFERQFGTEFRRRLPAASAVGYRGGKLVVQFLAAAQEPVHKENPRQIPAYDYPEIHGPRPPSFSRATLVRFDDAAEVFVSGTSAVVGHQSVAAGSTRKQLECTLENLEAVSLECGLGPDLARGHARLRQFTVYLRNPEEQPWVMGALEGRLFEAHDLVHVAHAEICRAELNIEIEATLRGVRLGQKLN